LLQHEIKQIIRPLKNDVLTAWVLELLINETDVNLQICRDKFFVRPGWKLVIRYKRLPNWVKYGLMTGFCEREIVSTFTCFINRK
jgi:hypothetical protein